MNMKTVEYNTLNHLMDTYQSMLLPYAYNIVGDAMEAEDIVQEVLNRYLMSSSEHIEKPDNYLIRSVINRSINQKKLLRNRKEVYPGEWMPTPVYTEEGIYARVDQRHILNYSLLVLLEHLSVKERTVFILKESFDYTHTEVADILGIPTESSRQLLKRGKEKLAQGSSQSFVADRDSQQTIQNLAEAILEGDVEQVKHLLSEEVQSISDGGPKMSAARKIIVGQERVYKFLKAVYGKYLPSDTSTKFTTLNHKPALLYYHQGVIFRAIIFEIKQQTIEKIFIMLNPDKLQSLNNLH